MFFRKQSTSLYPINFLMTSSSDHISPATGVGVVITISKNGGEFASPTGTVSELGAGWYSFAGSTSDRNTLGELIIHAVATGCDVADIKSLIVPFDPFDAVNLGLSNLDATIASRLSSAGYTAPDNTSITNIKTQTDKLTFDAVNRIVSTGLFGPVDVWAASTRTLTGSVSITSNSDITAIKANTDKLTFDGANRVVSTGLFGPTDIWSAATRTLTGSVNINSNADITNIKIKTDGLNFIGNNVLAQPTGLTSADIWDYVSRSLTAAVNINSNSDITAIKVNTDKLTFDGANRVYSSGDAGAGGGASAADIWTYGTRNLTGNVTVATGVGTYFDVPISTRLSASSYIVPDNAALAEIQAKTDLLTFDGANRVFSSGVAEGLAAADVWNYATRSLNTNVVIATGVGTYFDAPISTRLSSSSFVVPDNAGIAAIQNKTDRLTFDASNRVYSSGEVGASISAADVWTYGSRSLTASVNITSNSDLTAIKAQTDKFIFSPDNKVVVSGIPQTFITAADIWAYNTRSLNTNVVVATGIGTYFDAPISTRLASASYTLPDNASITSIKTQTDKFVFDSDNYIYAHPTGVSQLAAIDIWNYGTRNLTSAVNINSNSDLIAVKAWTDSYVTPTGISSADVWGYSNRSLTAAVIVPTGVGTYFDVPISTRLAGSAYIAPDNTSISNIKTQTDKLLFDGSNYLFVYPTGVNFATPAQIWDHGTRGLTSNVNINSNSDIIAIKTKTDQLVFSSGVVSNASGIMNYNIEAGYTLHDVLKLISSVLLGARSGGGTTNIAFAGLDGSTIRVAMTQNEAGNSTSGPVLTP